MCNSISEEAKDITGFLEAFSGSYNLNPFEVGYTDMERILGSANSRDKRQVSLSEVLCILKGAIKGAGFGLRLAAVLLFKGSFRKSVDTSEFLFLAYEDSWRSGGRKYYGDLIERIRSEGRKADILYLDVVGEESPRRIQTLYRLLNKVDIVACLLCGMTIQLRLALSLATRTENLKLEEGIVVATKGDVFRLVLNFAGFRCLLAKYSSAKCIVSLLEGDSFNYCLARAKAQCRIVGYIHGIARPGQLSMLKFIRRNEDWELAVSDSITKKFFQRFLPDKQFEIVEHLRHKREEVSSRRKIRKHKKTILAIGGIDSSVSLKMFQLAVSIKSEMEESIEMILRPHPGCNQMPIQDEDSSVYVDRKSSLEELIDYSDLVLVSSTSSACLDVIEAGMIPFIYREEGIVDLCPMPPEDCEYPMSLVQYMKSDGFAGPVQEYVYRPKKVSSRKYESFCKWGILLGINGDLA